MAAITSDSIALNASDIKAQAGHGGNITINSANVMLSQQSIISASSRRGVDSGELLTLRLTY